jgi:hypothetical protein
MTEQSETKPERLSFSKSSEADELVRRKLAKFTEFSSGANNILTEC